ncbi:MAG TPA: ATP-binding protein [Acidimicrobiia bacterium]|nr:ATP-binding protein [Acidimicrobiia bacterium]
MKSTAEILRGLPYFADLPGDLLSRVCDASEQFDLDEGTVIIQEGTDSEEMYVVVSGELVVTKQSGGKEVELGRIGPGDVVGEIALLDEAPRTATVSALGPSHVIRVPVAAFEDLLSDSRVVRRMFRTVTSRLRGIEDTLRHEERMAALGKMAAQLMHELNNPAAAVARSTQELTRLQAELRETATRLSSEFGERAIDLDPEPGPPLSALERADAEDQLVTWLESLGVDAAWDIAPALIEAGWTQAKLEEAVSASREELRPALLHWIGLRAATDQVVGELGIGARRIAELVRVVKEYSFLDRAPIQEVDIASGISDTLVLLKHKLRSVEIELNLADDLLRVEAPGRDLNQVWTNLIDNAADAMPEGGRLRITAKNDGQEVVVAISDTGHGIPEDIQPKVFDPFFTTKEPGKGTGLGMHTVHTIIGRIGGSIALDSGPEGTTFTVRLPAVDEVIAG